MTSPDKRVPNGAYVASTVGQAQSVTMDAYKRKTAAETAASMLGARQQLSGAWLPNIIQEIGQAMSGTPSEGYEPIRDGQLDLVGRLDLLDGVRGYCSAYQSLNINTALSLGNSRRRELPFGSPYGPAKLAHVDATKGGIVFEEAGLWTVHCLIHARQTAFAAGGFGEPDASAMFVRIHKPDGTIDSETVVDAHTSNSTDSITATLPFVIPEPDYYVTIGCWSSRWRWWDGGTRYTRLSVVMSDNRPTNPGAETVPDET